MSELKDYLDYYKSLSNPGYAVLITGAWGVGKTYQVKDALKADEYYYVSLFGLESRETIEAALLTEANPSLVKNKGWLRRGAQKAKEVGGLYSLIGVLPSAINALLKIELNPQKIIVFDDLERCNLDIKTLFGVINWFVEHQGSKVVVIAHDDKLGEELETQKEKIFGHTISIEPKLTAAFYVFLEEIRNSKFMSSEKAEEATKFLRANRRIIFSVFEQQVVENDEGEFQVYGGNSLRVLRRCLFDVARLYSIIEPKYLSHEDTVFDLVSEFCIFNLEHKMGALPVRSLTHDWADEIRGRWERQMRGEDGTNVTFFPLEKVEHKYAQIRLNKLFLDQRVLSELIVKGNYDANLLNERLSVSTYFSTPKDLPAWRRFMSFDELDDDIVELAKEELLDQFKNREIHDVGEMLNMFALRFMMSENEIIDHNIQAVEKSCFKYIDDLLFNGELPPRPTDSDWPAGLRYENSYGYAYWVKDSYKGNFEKVHQHLNNARVKAFDNNGEKIGEEILTALKNDFEEFTKLISYRLGEGKYALIPVMHTINIDELIDIWFELPKVTWRHIQYAFNSRYEHGRLQNDEHNTGELVAEREWTMQLREALEKRAAAVTGYQRLRIMRIIPNLPKAE